MKLESEECPFPIPPSLGSRLAHHRQHFLKSQSAFRYFCADKVRQLLRRIRERNRDASRQFLALFQPDLKLDPDSERMRSQLIISQRGINRLIQDA